MNNFTLREIECFVAVAEELSFSRAAKSINLSQPPLSRHIRSLENKLGSKLFVRNQRTVQLTAAGKVFQKETRGILTQLSRAEEAVKRTDDPTTGSLDIAFNSSLLSSNLIDVFRRFQKTCPNVRLTLHDCLAVDQVDAVRNGRLDIGFVGFAPTRRDDLLEFKLWKREPLIALLPDNHKLGNRKRIRITELRSYSMVTLHQNAEPAFRDYIVKLCANAGFTPKITQEASRAQAVAVMAIAGSSVALLPKNMTKIIEGGLSKDLLDIEGKKVFLEHMVVTRRLQSPEAQSFLQVLRER